MYDTTIEREYVLAGAIEELETVNAEIAKLTVRREELTREIIAAVGHDKEGQKSYNYREWKVTCKTPNIYALDTRAYKSGKVFLPEEDDPVKQSITYTVDKKRFQECYKNATDLVRDSLNKLITVKPGKPSVSVEYIG
jgi:citrate synthase